MKTDLKTCNRVRKIAKKPIYPRRTARKVCEKICKRDTHGYPYPWRLGQGKNFLSRKEGLKGGPYLLNFEKNM